MRTAALRAVKPFSSRKYSCVRWRIPENSALRQVLPYEIAEFIRPDIPALVLAPMDGITDAPMRALQGALGGFSYAVTEFLRVSVSSLPASVFRKAAPELSNNGFTPTGLPVQIQILGGDPGRMALSAQAAVRAGAGGIDINFGCPAPTVNRHDGGASLLREPCRIREIVAAVRDAVPLEIPVSAKLRLGWNSIDAIHENAAMAAEGGASWLTIHARTKLQGYAPPVYWKPIGQVRRNLNIPIVANGDIWSIADFRQCQDETGCIHFMIGRSALACPGLPLQIAAELGLGESRPAKDWDELLHGLVEWSTYYGQTSPKYTVRRLKQWLKLASNFGDFPYFDAVKESETPEELFQRLASASSVDRLLERA